MSHFLRMDFPPREIPEMVAPCADNPIVKVEYDTVRSVRFTLANGATFKVMAFDGLDAGELKIGVTEPKQNKEEQ